MSWAKKYEKVAAIAISVDFLALLNPSVLGVLPIRFVDSSPLHPLPQFNSYRLLLEFS
jgi:hypothetical protein